MNEPIIQIDGFSKRYGDFTAVHDLSLAVQPGEIFGLLGPNGAGKTTTLECLEGIRTPDAGTLRVAGIDPARDGRALRAVLGVQLQSSGMPEMITPAEAMNLFCGYHGVAPRTDLLDRLGLGAKRDTPFHALSTGQQRRLALALAVAHDPRVLLLDEPTAGLDVQTRVELHSLLRERQAAGTTIILATHDMAEAETMSDRVAILLQGHCVATGSPLELTATGQGLTKVSVHTQQGLLLNNGHAFPAASCHGIHDDYAIYFSRDIGRTVGAIIATIEQAHDTIIDLRVERPSLEDRFLELTGRATG
jgi:ABC-2 type transport system ATP-binding protein